MRTGTKFAPWVLVFAAIHMSMLLLMLLDLAACGGASNSTPPPPPPPGITITISPTSGVVAPGAAQTFQATVTGTNEASVNWSVNGIVGGSATVGTISSAVTDTATFTAPAAPPSPSQVTVAATSQASSSASAAAQVTIACGLPNAITPPAATLAPSGTQSFTASLCIAPGTTVNWDVNGIAGGNSSIGTIASTGPSTANYIAPATPPPTDPVTIHATLGSQSASASVTISSPPVTVTISPGSASVMTGQRVTFTAAVSGTNNQGVTWAVNGVANGNSTVGQICIAASNPCATPSGAVAGSVDYLAPQSVPATNPVTLTATSAADPSASATAKVTISSATQITVSVAPFYAFVAPSGGSPSQYRFFASVTGTANTGVTWSVQSAVAGQGCAGTACGTVDSNGVYTAPAAAPSPNAITVTATSQADTSKNASATVVLTNGPAIETLVPSSVMGGALEGFPLTIEGLNFVAGSGTSASQILINGQARETQCQLSTRCGTALGPGDVASAGTLTVLIQNPGAPAPLSNPVPFVIVPFTTEEDSVALSGSQPTANGKDIVVFEPTNAASTGAINVDFAGPVTKSGGATTCTFEATPQIVTRPASGSTTASICVHGNGLDPSFLYVFTGPPGGDISVSASSLAGLFPNLIELDLTISSATLPGLRTLFITTLNNDRAAATGILEVK